MNMGSNHDERKVNKINERVLAVSWNIFVQIESEKIGRFDIWFEEGSFIKS